MRLNCAASCNWGGGGGAHFECVSVSQLGVFGGMLPWKMFKFKPSEMAKTNMVL